MMNTRLITEFPNRRPRIATAGAIRPILHFKFPLTLLILHIPLGILLYNSRALALIHPLVVFFIGVRWAYRKQEKLERPALVAAYIIGVEVLWRMAQAPIFWESGKYAAAAIMIIALWRRGCSKIPTLPLFYFLLLLPACFLTLFNNDLSVAKDRLSFTMSGPFLLFVSCWFFSHLKITPTQTKKLLLAVIVPLTSVAVTTLFYTVTTSNIQFTEESNFATSGGFGPNQVSAMLGLGAFLCVACYLIFKNRFPDNLYLCLLAILFTTQSVLTFSRGGIYNAVGAILAVVLFQMRDLNQGIKRLIPIIGLAGIFLLLIFPYLNAFTGGSLQARFDDTESTSRLEIAESDFQIFAGNPILGAGVGSAYEERAQILDRKAASHTEFSRIIAEHGIFGVFSLVVLILTVGYNIKRQKSNIGKALVGGLVVWGGLFMLNAGMRLAAPSFIWGASFLTIVGGQPRKSLKSL